MKKFFKLVGAIVDSRRFFLAIVALGILGASARLLGRNAAGQHPASHQSQTGRQHVADPANGEYLVRNVGMCADCHTPRDATGNFVAERWLLGGTIDFRPSSPIPSWAEVATPIAGLPTFATDREAVEFLTEGKRPDGRMARPPMPVFRLQREDAEDVAAYLRSLSPSNQPTSPTPPTRPSNP